MRTHAKVKHLPVSIALCQASSPEGDSGGPLLIPNRFGGSIATGSPRFDLLVGVTSFGSEDCTDTSPTIYTSIGAFWGWILEKIDEDPEVNCFRHPFLVSDRLEQEKNRQQSVEQPSADGDEDAKPPAIERSPDNETKKEQSEKRKIEKERARMTKLSRKEMIEVALTMEIAVNELMVL